MWSSQSLLCQKMLLMTSPTIFDRDVCDFSVTDDYVHRFVSLMNLGSAWECRVQPS